MAAIIAKITREARERKQRELEHPTVDIQRSVYVLPRFDPHFDPEKHNVWLKRYVQAEEKKELSKLEEFMKVQEMRRRRSCIHFVPFSWRLCIFESVIIGSLLAIVPLALLVVEILFQE